MIMEKNSAVVSTKIDIHFRQAMACAEMLEEAAKEIKQTATQNVSNSIQTIYYGWKGEHAKTFLQKYEKLQQEMMQTAKELHKTAYGIRKAATVIYAAEIAALQVATNRQG